MSASSFLRCANVSQGPPLSLMHLMISQCQATFPAGYSNQFVSHCKSIRDCYTLGRSRFCNSVTLWDPPSLSVQDEGSFCPKSVTPQHMDSRLRRNDGVEGEMTDKNDAYE